MAAATMYVTVAGAGDKSGDTWAKAMGYAEWETDYEGSSEAGDIYYVAGGTYTLTSAFDGSARAGSSVAPISIIGVVTGTSNEPPVYSDWATGDDRPLIASGANLFRLGTHFKMLNFRETTSASQGVISANYGTHYNNKIIGDGSTSFGINSAAYERVISCEISVTHAAGTALALGSASCATFCYLHDTKTGILFNAVFGVRALFNIVDTCATIGISVAATYGNSVVNNTVYNCGVGINGTTCYSSNFINNIINDCTTGANWTTQEDSNIWLNNNPEGNGTDYTNVAVTLPHSDFLETTVNPAFTDDSGGDFSLATGSGCIDAGLAMALGVG